jgi:ethanolamine utilization protein EutQ (cupin superfamily)
LRGNAILRWEYQPGSTLFLVWTQDRSDTVLDGEFSVREGMSRMFAGPADNVFLVKISYWWRP